MKFDQSLFASDLDYSADDYRYYTSLKDEPQVENDKSVYSYDVSEELSGLMMLVLLRRAYRCDMRDLEHKVRITTTCPEQQFNDILKIVEKEAQNYNI